MVPPPGPTLLYFSAVFMVNYAHVDIDFWVQVLDHFLVEGIVGVPYIYIYIFFDTIRKETVVNEDLLGGNSWANFPCTTPYFISNTSAQTNHLTKHISNGSHLVKHIKGRSGGGLAYIYICVL